VRTYNIIYLYVRALFMIGIKNYDNITKKGFRKKPAFARNGFRVRLYTYVDVNVCARIIAVL
jgi:hypothetical protein